MNNNGQNPPEFAQKIVEKYVSAQSNAFLIYGNTKDIYLVSENKYVPLIDFLVDALIRPAKPTAPRIVLLYDPVNGISFLNPIDRQLISLEIGESRLQKMLAAARSDIVLACAALRDFTNININIPVEGRPGKK